jgi:hypothetical protein
MITVDILLYACSTAATSKYYQDFCRDRFIASFWFEIYCGIFK